MSEVRVEEQAGIAGALMGSTYVVTLATAQQGNRLATSDMLAFIGELERAADSGAVMLLIRAIGPDFCMGRLQGESVPGMTRLDSLRLILRANATLRSFAGVSIALVQGRAFGFGAGTALQCDLTVAADDAVFAFDEVRHGLAPLVVAEYLPAYVGDKRSLRMILTGTELGADEALRDGIVSHVVPASGLESEGEHLCAQLGTSPPGALRLMKRYVSAVRAGELDDVHDTALVWLDDWLSDGRPEWPRA